jgi:hypothetical protein
MTCADCDLSEACRCVRLRWAKAGGLPPIRPRSVIENVAEPAASDVRVGSRRAGYAALLAFANEAARARK